MIGRAERGETADVNYMEVLVELKPQDEWPEKITYAELSRRMMESLEQALLALNEWIEGRSAPPAPAKGVSSDDTGATNHA